MHPRRVAAAVVVDAEEARRIRPASLVVTRPSVVACRIHSARSAWIRCAPRADTTRWVVVGADAVPADSVPKGAVAARAGPADVVEQA